MIAEGGWFVVLLSSWSCYVWLVGFWYGGFHFVVVGWCASLSWGIYWQIRCGN